MPRASADGQQWCIGGAVIYPEIFTPEDGTSCTFLQLAQGPLTVLVAHVTHVTRVMSLT